MESRHGFFPFRSFVLFFVVLFLFLQSLVGVVGCLGDLLGDAVTRFCLSWDGIGRSDCVWGGGGIKKCNRDDNVGRKGRGRGVDSERECM